ncbi:glycoside hydrolase superfamily [Schizophyllum fasciatum]
MSPLSLRSALLASAFVGARALPTRLGARAPSTDKKVIIQIFDWNWDSIAQECTDFIGPAGYGFVQVSPPQETISGDQWWTDYQPVSYTLQGKRGDRDGFAAMVNACHDAGVNVIADTIWNHMAGVESGTGTAGTSFSHYEYPNLYSNQDFHHCGLESGDDIVNYQNREEVQTCELVNLADLATESDYVRGKLADYANDLISLGVDGLRLDASKHIPTDDIKAILGQLSGSVYITQEVIFGDGEPITPAEYTQNGDVQEFRYTHTIRDAFNNNALDQLQDLESKGWVAGSSANVFVANHDTERGGDSLNYNSPNNIYTTAMIFSLAHPYGTPTILSSFEFSDKDSGAPNGNAGTCSDNGGANGWLCQHRWTAVANMVAFRNEVGDAELNNWVSPQGSQIAFGRGSAGFVAINNGDSEWSTTFTTSIADGSYCDVISGFSNGTCSGNTITVSGGSFQGTVPARSALAIHTGATA